VVFKDDIHKETQGDDSNLAIFKWKMYIDIDIDESSSSNESSNKESKLLACIRDVKFLSKNQFEQFNIGKPPFIMRHWAKNKLPTNSIKISCIITYENKVVQPKKTIIEYELKPDPLTHQTQVIYENICLTLEDDNYLQDDSNTIKSKNIPNNNNNNNNNVECSSSTSSCTSTATNAMALIAANIQYQLTTNILTSSSSMSSMSPSPQLTNPKENVWTKRNLENSVIIPQTHVVKNSSDLWSGIVKGKYKGNLEKRTVENAKNNKVHVSRPSSSSSSISSSISTSPNTVKNLKRYTQLGFVKGNKITKE
jgi:hypothetical protein